MKRIVKIAVTGGPCAGKTTVMEALKGEYERRDFNVAIVPEVATVLFTGGFNTYAARGEHETALLQAEILKVQKALEDAFALSLAAHERSGVMLCDRGMLDNKGYTTPEGWKLVQYYARMYDNMMRDRYHGVLQLQSAAVGAEDHYKKTPIRRECLAEAAALEQKMLEAWSGHKLYCLVENRDDGFDGKVRRAVNASLYIMKQIHGKDPIRGC